MSFVTEFNSLPLDALVKRSQTSSVAAAREAAGKATVSLADFAAVDFSGRRGIAGTAGPRARSD